MEDILNDRQLCDSKFFLKLLYYADTVAQNFIKNCREASDASVLRFRSLDPASIVQHVELGTLQITLSSCVTASPKKKQQSDQPPPGPPSKKKKEESAQEQVKGFKATAENSKPTWRLPKGVKYLTAFPIGSWYDAPKHRLSSGTLQDICLNLHATGQCKRKNCPNFHGKLPPAEETEFETYVTSKHAAIA